MKEALAHDVLRALRFDHIVVNPGIGIISRSQFAIPINHLTDFFMYQVAIAGVDPQVELGGTSGFDNEDVIDAVVVGGEHIGYLQLIVDSDRPGGEIGQPGCIDHFQGNVKASGTLKLITVNQVSQLHGRIGVDQAAVLSPLNVVEFFSTGNTGGVTGMDLLWDEVMGAGSYVCAVFESHAIVLGKGWLNEHAA